MDLLTNYSSDSEDRTARGTSKRSRDGNDTSQCETLDHSEPRPCKQPCLASARAVGVLEGTSDSLYLYFSHGPHTST
jgi:hypothetical protein